MPWRCRGRRDAASTPPTTPIAADGSDLDSARAGLARILANAPNASIEPYAPLGPCPLVDRATVNGELADAGIDAPLGDWTRLAYPDGPHTDVLLACEGTYIGVDEDPSFPELRFDVVVIDLGDAATADGVLHDELEATGEPLRITDLDGGTIGECGDEDRAVRCAEWWQHDGFVVGVEIVDRVFVDRPTASTVLGGVVPAIVSTLGAAATDIADPLQTIGAADAGRALDALDAFVDANPEAVSSEHERIDCPLLDSESLRPALDDAGIDWPLGGWAASISPVTFPRDLDPVPQRVSCTNRSGSVTVDAIAFGDDGQAADFVASVGGAEGGSASDLAPGDLTVGSCTSASGAKYCNEWWRGDGLVLGVTLFSDPSGPDHGPIGANDAANILVTIVPEVLTTLAP